MRTGNNDGGPSPSSTAFPSSSRATTRGPPRPRPLPRPAIVCCWQGRKGRGGVARTVEGGQTERKRMMNRVGIGGKVQFQVDCNLIGRLQSKRPPSFQQCSRLPDTNVHKTVHHLYC